MKNDGTPGDMKFLRRIPTREYWDFGVQLRLRLTNIAFILSLKLLYQQGYIVIRGSIWDVKWTDMLKWPQNPKYYSAKSLYSKIPYSHNGMFSNVRFAKKR